MGRVATDLIAEVQPEFVVIGIGFPKQQRLALGLMSRLDAAGSDLPIFMLLGGSLDMHVGRVRRAPTWIQRAGLEWLFRFALEPRRLFRRYFVTDMRFFGLLARELLAESPSSSARRGGEAVIIRSRAPLRISLAGGGTDLAEYSDRFGGGVLNATINMSAYATITPRRDGVISMSAVDRGEHVEVEATSKLELDGTLDLAKGSTTGWSGISTTEHRWPSTSRQRSMLRLGSGLGSSSTLVVAILGAFTEWLKLPLGEYDIADLAFAIERLDLGLAGGRQDQFAATFGGWNFIEFFHDNRVIADPLLGSARRGSRSSSSVSSSTTRARAGCPRPSSKVRSRTWSAMTPRRWT